MKYGIVGSRDFADLDAVKAFVRALKPGVDVVISGTEPGKGPYKDHYGVDETAVAEARACGVEAIVYAPNPDAIAAFGFSAAAHERNRKIASACDELYAFWDGRSRGTASTIKYAEDYGKKVTIIEPKPPERSSFFAYTTTNGHVWTWDVTNGTITTGD